MDQALHNDIVEVYNIVNRIIWNYSYRVDDYLPWELVHRSYMIMKEFDRLEENPYAIAQEIVHMDYVPSE